MKSLIVFFLMVGSLIAAPLSLPRPDNKAKKDHADQAKTQTDAIQQSSDYAVYTNIVSLLNAAQNWNDAKPLLIKYIKVQQGLQDVSDIYTGKKDKKVAK